MIKRIYKKFCMKLIEFKNHKGEVLRGLLDQGKSKRGVIFLHGFERTTVEMKFKNLRDGLAGKANIFRFDFSGCGLSDGKFEDTSVEKMTKELEKAYAVFKKQGPQIKEFIVVGHSLSGCVALNFVAKHTPAISKMILFGPALNQKELLKYYFVRAKMLLQKIFIDWNNFHSYFLVDEYEQDLQIKKRMRKSHFITNKYFLENKDKDYQDFISKLVLAPRNILIIQGNKDDKVPLESNNNLPKGIKFIKVMNGDHDLERPDMVKQYLAKTIKFILN